MLVGRIRALESQIKHGTCTMFLTQCFGVLGVCQIRANSEKFGCQGHISTYVPFASGLSFTTRSATYRESTATSCKPVKTKLGAIKY